VAAFEGLNKIQNGGRGGHLENFKNKEHNFE
jgi:hypothetical protein